MTIDGKKRQKENEPPRKGEPLGRRKKPRKQRLLGRRQKKDFISRKVLKKNERRKKRKRKR